MFMINSGFLAGGRAWRRLAWVGLLSILLFSSLIWIAGAQKPEGDETPPPAESIDPALRLKIDPALFKQLVTGDQGRLPVVVEFQATADLQAALAEAVPSRRRESMVAALQATAHSAQAGALALLAEREALGQAANVRSLWIVNALAAEAGRDAVLALAGRPEVRMVRRDREYHITDGPQTLPGPAPHAQGVDWNITQIRADVAWNALQVDGSGVVVANIDTGVDFYHPALHTHYRGYDSHGLHMHSCNWYDATDGGATYPVDNNGHGTHTMGTAVGQGGIGVAPGATWITVRAFDNQGQARESWLHAAMQWVIDPGPGCTPPQVVNNSWGAEWGGTEVFRGDVQKLRAAGIFAAFAAGNDGPETGSVDAPASYPEAFGVGAVMQSDTIASFSGRGPSTWFKQQLIKPDVAAPGVNVRSSLPGGAYGEKQGTSMATPHVVGLAALLLQADPSLSVDEIETVIRQTAVPHGSPRPNNDYGWGRIDAYAALIAVANAGIVDGGVVRAANGQPIPGAEVTADPATPGLPPSVAARAFTGMDGRYNLALAPGRYTLAVAAFGYSPTSRAIEVLAETTLTENFSLAGLPTGTLSGKVTSGGQAVQPPAALQVIGTPVVATTSVTGAYAMSLPTGRYTLTVSSPEHRVGVARDVQVSAGETTSLDFELAGAPSILLVDSGAWYYQSEIDYYRQALDELHYTYDTWTVETLPADVPAASDLLPYDIVFWSSPEDSPGYIDASDVLTTYLKSGGSLFLSGQDVAYYDDFYAFIYAPYLRAYIQAHYVADDAGVFDLTSEAGGLFEGLTFTIKGPGGADNQTAPDVIRVANDDFAASTVTYADGGSGGQQVGECLPYRAIYLSYGFESITDPAVRTEVISRSMAWFDAPPRSTGVELTPSSGQGIGNFGQTISHTLRIRNLAETGGATAFTLSHAGADWPTSLTNTLVTLSPCQSAQVGLLVQVPPGATWTASDLVTVTARSATASATATRETRAPAPALLVDDDRFFNVEGSYRNALASNGIPYDEWQVPLDFQDGQPASPPLDILRRYPMVLWFSAYDWYQPLTTLEENRLAAYLEGGGRLYYNGQDYLFHSEGPNDFARTYLGVQSYTEDLTSTMVVGRVDSPVGSFLGPQDLVYPYDNYSDGLTPTDNAAVAFVGEEGQPNALTVEGRNAQGAGRTWHTAFFAFNPDGLDDPTQARLIDRVTGWLSWLGSSNVKADKALTLDTDRLTYRVVVRHDGWQDIAAAYWTAAFNSDLRPIPDSVTGGASWDAARSAFVWAGPLTQGQSLTFTYQADIAGPLPGGHVVSHTVWMGYDSHFIEFDRVAATRVNAPDVSPSTFSVSPAVGEIGSRLTYTLQVRNAGVADGLITAANPLPANLALAPGSLQVSRGDVQTDGRAIMWSVPLAVSDVATLTYQATITDIITGMVLRNRVMLDDGMGVVLPLDAVAALNDKAFFPIILKP